jgi:uncharacterized delta-60 repeat protein
MKRILQCLLISVAAGRAFALPMDLDPGFAPGSPAPGFLLTPLTAQVSFADVLPLADGRVLAVGDNSPGGSTNQIPGAVMLRADGSVDASFGTNGIFSQDVIGGLNVENAARVLQTPDGGFVILAAEGNTARLDLIKLTATGALDTTFGTDGRASLSASQLPGPGQSFQSAIGGQPIALDTQGRILLASAYRRPGDSGLIEVHALCRFTAGGQLDLSYSANADGVDGCLVGTGTATNDQFTNVRGMALDGDAAIITGSAVVNGSGSRFGALRATAGGALDPAFGDGGIVKFIVGGGSSPGVAVERRPDGRLLFLTGSSTALLQLLPDGSIDTTFGNGNGLVVGADNELPNANTRFANFNAGDGRDLALQADGRALIVTRFSTLNCGGETFTGALVARVLADGTVDTGFGETSTCVIGPEPVIGGSVQAIALANDGSIFIAGGRGGLTANTPAVFVAKLLGGPGAARVDPFVLEDRSDVPQSTDIRSNDVVISGLADDVPALVRQDIGFTTVAGSTNLSIGVVYNGDTLSATHRSAAAPGVRVTQLVRVGAGADEVLETFETTTAVPVDDVPDPFTFNDASNVQPQTTVVSNTVTLSGFNVPLPIRVTGGEYSIDGGPFTAVEGTVEVGSTVRVRHLSAACGASDAETTLTVGTVSDTFSSRVAAFDSSLFSIIAPDVDEDGGTLTATIERRNAGCVAATVAVRTLDDTATAPADYLALATTVDFAAGENGVRTVQVVIVDDAIEEGDERFQVEIDPPGLLPTFDVATIRDDDVPAPTPTPTPTATPSPTPTSTPTATPNPTPTPTPTATATPAPTAVPTPVPTIAPTPQPTPIATPTPTPVPTATPTPTPVPDGTPDPFTFGRVLGVEPQSVQLSGAITVAGINQAVALTVSGGQVSINGGPFASSGSVRSGDRVAVRLAASTAFEATTTATVTIGGVAGSFEAVTRAADAEPDPLAFNPVIGVMPGTTQTSNTVTVTGIEAPVTVTVLGGLISVNGGAFTSGPVLVADGDRIALRAVAPETFGGIVDVTIDVGGALAVFRVDVTTQLPDIVVEGGAGGGAVGATLLLMLGLIAALRRRQWRWLAAAIGLWGGVASAQGYASEPAAFYAGLRLGPSFSDVDSASTTRALRNQGFEVDARVSDDVGSVTVFGGWRVTPRYGVEVGYTRSPDTNVRLAGTAPPTLDPLLRAAARQIRGLGSALSLTATARWPLWRVARIRAHAGPYLWRTEADVSVPDLGAGFSETTSGGGLTAGAALIWQLDGDIALGLSVDHFASADDASYTTIGARLEWGF